MLPWVLYISVCHRLFYTTDDYTGTNDYTRTNNWTTADHDFNAAAIPDNDTAATYYVLATHNLVATYDATSSNDATSAAHDT
jgi:hypothetical protein